MLMVSFLLITFGVKIRTELPDRSLGNRGGMEIVSSIVATKMLLSYEGSTM